MTFFRKLAVGLGVFAAMLVQSHSATVTINGAVTNQVIDGFGANINFRSWTNNELKPVLDGLVDTAGMSLFRVTFDRADWEGTNDNGSASVMDWNYYNTLYSSPRLEKYWSLIEYLNQKGITNGVMLNFQGAGPSWLGGATLTPGLEEEWAEMVASLVIYARNTRGLKFYLLAPENEPDGPPQGIAVGADQYVTMLHKLAEKLDTNGMSDIRFVGPDIAFSANNSTYMTPMMNDSLIMSKLARFGVHSYTESGTAGVEAFINGSAYPNSSFWVTEYNGWCENCEDGEFGTYDWAYCRGTAEHLLAHIGNGASAGMVWEGYDSQYAIINPNLRWSLWGLYGINDTNAAVKTYTPRKNLYTLAQYAKFIRPGANRIGITGSVSPFMGLHAFYNTEGGQLTLTGINPSGATSLSATLSSLPAITFMDLYYTTSASNLVRVANIPVTNGAFSTGIPADCVFTLTGFDPAKLVVSLLAAAQSNNVTLTWTNSPANLILESTTSILPPVTWSAVTNAPQHVGNFLRATVAPTNTQRYFRLRKP